MPINAAARAFACAFAVASATSADAEDAADQTIIVTAQNQTDAAEERIARTPGGTDIVTAADYADKSLVSLRDALAFSPGVYLQPRFGQEVRVSIRGSGLSRGFHMRGLTLLQDGIPINLADDNGDFQELDPAFFDHLEVWRGGNALRFGSGTLGGAINGVTPTGVSAKGLYARLDAGSFDLLRGLISAGFGNERANAWAAIAADTADGDRDHARRRSIRFHGNAGFRLSDMVSTRFYASVNNIDQELPGALTLATALAAPKTGNFVGDQARDIDSLRLQNRTTITLGQATVEVGGFVNAKQLYHPIFQVVDQESTDYGASARLEYESGPFALTLGSNARFGSVRSKRFVNINGKRGAPTFAADQKARTIDVYGEARLQPFDGLSLIAGGIYADGRRRQRQRLPVIATGRADFTAFSPKFGMLYEPATDIQVFANYSRSAEFPGFVELAQIASFVPFDAQRAWTFEAGTRGKIGIASWDVAIYRADLKGELLQFTVGPNIPASTFNARRTRHQGVEAGLTLEPASWLRLRQVWQYSDFRFREDAQFGDDRLPVIPTNIYRAELRFGSDAAHVSPNLEWVPKGAWADYANTTRVAGYTLIGLTAGVRVREGIDIFLDARNLTGKKAIGDISAVILANAGSAIYYPVERRAFYGGVRARF